VDFPYRTFQYFPAYFPAVGRAGTEEKKYVGEKGTGEKRSGEKALEKRHNGKRRVRKALRSSIISKVSFTTIQNNPYPNSYT